MAFLTENDYKMLIYGEDLDIVQDEDETIRQDVEEVAQVQLSNSLRNRYDVDAIFAATGDDRDKLIIMYMVDITLYHLWTKIPGRVIPEERVLRYEDAMKWLDKVNTGKIQPDLPKKDEYDSGIGIRTGYNDKKNWLW